MMDKNKISSVLKSSRNTKRLTQAEVAKMAGMSRTYYSDLESGRYMPSLDKMVNIADILEIDLNLFRNVGISSKKTITNEEFAEEVKKLNKEIRRLHLLCSRAQKTLNIPKRRV